MTSLLNYLQDSLKVTVKDNDHVEVTVVLPSDLFLPYIRLLDSLTGFVRILDRKTRLARSSSPERNAQLDLEAQQAHAAYYAKLAEAFDRYTAQGLNRNETIKRISAELRKAKHPWSSPELVRTSLAAAGRSGRPGRPRRQP